ncbi:hypothetical protein, partial [Fibrobacter sp. UWCM]|uniref:hypothetical protein n=1 Tax=Fibrobacter sp. UWCM TaxID=1896208 RepID=UPI001C31B293
GMDGRKSLLNREGNGKICFLCMNLQKKTCLIGIPERISSKERRGAFFLIWVSRPFAKERL